MNKVRWLSFSASYDFGYLLKILTDQKLPSEESEFRELLHLYFPNVYDVKYLMNSTQLKGGLQDVADFLEIERKGLIIKIFFRLGWLNLVGNRLAWFG